MSDNVKVVDATEVRFVTDDGRTMFEVRWANDGRSIDVRGVDCSKHGDVMLSESLDLRPICSNMVNVRAVPFKEL
jgi:hypothetical protein